MTATALELHAPVLFLVRRKELEESAGDTGNLSLELNAIDLLEEWLNG